MLLWAVSGVTAQASGVSMVGNGSPPFHKPQCFAACTHGSRMVIGCHIQSIRHSDDLCMHNKNGLVSRHRHEAMLQAPRCVLQVAIHIHLRPALQASGSQHAAEEPSYPLIASHKLDSIAQVCIPDNCGHDKSRDLKSRSPTGPSCWQPQSPDMSDLK